VNESSNHRNTSQGNRFAANLGASGDVAPMITARGSPPTPNTARYAWTVFRSGVLETWITGDVIATSTRLPLRNHQRQHVRDQKRICHNEGDVGFDIVTIYGEKPTGTVPTPSFP
jgi:hypothetical protein